MKKPDQQVYEKYLKGFNLTDCVVRNRNMFYFLALEDQDDEADDAPSAKLISCLDLPNIQPWGQVLLKGMHYFMAGVAFKPKEQFVGISRNRHVYVVGGGERGFEDDLTGGRYATGRDIGMRGALAKLRTIGDYLWLTGNGRTVGRRVEKKYLGMA